MTQDSPEFLSNDFSHPHHRKAVAALVVAVLVFGGVVWFYLSRPLLAPDVSSTITPKSFSPTVPLTEKRATLLVLTAKASTSPLTTDMKSTIMQEFGGAKSAQYNFSSEEWKVILGALNGK